MDKKNWLNYWNEKNIWLESDLLKKNTEIFYQKTSNIFNYNKYCTNTFNFFNFTFFWRKN